jgi:hypothetical protein
MDSLSSFLAGVIGSADVNDVSIVHDAPRLPSESLVNMNRRAMGMEDFRAPVWLKKETREKQCRWEGLDCTKRGGQVQQDLVPYASKPAIRPGFASRGGSDSRLLRPIRRPSSPNSPTELLSSEETRNIHRWAPETRRGDPKLVVQDPASTTKPARRQGLDSDSTLITPRRRPSSPNSPTELLASEDLGARIATQSSSTFCENEEGVSSPQASKSITREYRETLMPRLMDSMLPPKKDETTAEVDEAFSVCCSPESGSLPSLTLAPRRGDRLLSPLQQTTIEELEQTELSLVFIDYDEAHSPSNSQCDIFGEHFSDSAISITERDDLLSPPATANAVVENNEDIKEESLRTMDLEANEIEYKGHENERSLSIQDIKLRTGGRSKSQQSDNTAPTTEMSSATACLLEGDFSRPLTRSSNSEDETDLGGRTTRRRLLARSNDSMRLLHAGTREKNPRGWQSRRDTRNGNYDAPTRRRLGQGTRGESINEPIGGNISDLTGSLNSVVEHKENIKEGSLGTMDLEADGIDYNEHDNERSLSIQDIEMRSGRHLESKRLQQNDITAPAQNTSSEGETGLGNQTKLLARCNDSVLLLQAGAAAMSPEKNPHAAGRPHTRGTRNVKYDTPTRRRRARGRCLSEQIRGHMSDLTLNSVVEDNEYIKEGSLARCNDSVLLLQAGAAGSRTKNLRGQHQSRETRNVNDVASRRRSEQLKGNMSDLTLNSVAVDSEDIKEGSLGTIDLEADGIDYVDSGY